MTYSQTIQTKSEPLAIRRPQQDFKYKDEILKTIAKLKAEGKAENTIARAMKKYPKEYEHFKEQLSRMQENFSKLAKIL
jgi:prefoldin subunit 5